MQKVSKKLSYTGFVAAPSLVRCASATLPVKRKSRRLAHYAILRLLRHLPRIWSGQQEGWSNAWLNDRNIACCGFAFGVLYGGRETSQPSNPTPMANLVVYT